MSDDLQSTGFNVEVKGNPNRNAVDRVWDKPSVWLKPSAFIRPLPNHGTEIHCQKLPVKIS
jgi:hypothetical protein